MNEQNDSQSFYFSTLSNIKDQFFRQKRQAIVFAEQMIQNKDLSHIPQILSCLSIENQYVLQLSEYNRRFFNLQALDADMRRLYIICKILEEEEEFPEFRPFFLEQADTFDDLMRKYVRITFLLRRMEFVFPEEVLRESAAMLMEEQVSICAIRKIIACEIFADKDYIYTQALKIKQIGDVLKWI